MFLIFALMLNDDDRKNDIENIGRFVNHWIESSDRDLNTMQNLYKSKDYRWSLFIGHLVI